MSMSDIEKLRVLLPHWLEHNTAHADDYRAWIERAQAAGKPHVAEHLAAAVEKLEGVNRDLQTALEHRAGRSRPGSTTTCTGSMSTSTNTDRTFLTIGVR